MADDRARAKGTTIKNIFIVILVSVIIVLLVSNALDEDTKKKFYWFAAFISLLIFIAYVLSKNKKLNIYKVAKDIVAKEYQYTGSRINIKDVNTDILDVDTLVFGFESGGDIVAYKWDLIDSVVIARLTKKIDEVKNEVNNRDIFNLIAKRSIERRVKKELADEAGLENNDENV
jgi:hypothetical protein